MKSRKMIQAKLTEALTSPAAAFISTAQPPTTADTKRDKAKGKPVKKETAATIQPPLFEIPEGMRLVQEPKSRRVHLLMRPTAYNWVEAEARAEGISVNEAINTIIEDAKKAKEGK